MVARARLLQARLLPHGWLDALRQVSLFSAAYFAYRLVRGMVEGDANAAFRHARDLISLERTMHLFVEPSIQAWASGSHFVMVGASWLYVNAQTTITLTALLYLYLRHNRNFYFVRNMFMIAMAIALVGYTVFPTAPPRFLPEWGFIDSVSDLTGVHVSHASASMNALFNPYAAVPSMHVAFALMIGWPLARLVRQRLRSRLVATVSAADRLRDRGYRQPLHPRRDPRRAHRRRVCVRRGLARAGAAERLALLDRTRRTIDRERVSTAASSSAWAC